MGVIPENADIMRYFGVWTYIQEEYIYICIYIYIYVFAGYKYVYKHIYIYICTSQI